MANDIGRANNNNPIKNGTTLVTTFNTGKYSNFNTYVQNTPNITFIENKYDNRFYNGIWVSVSTSGVIGS